MTQKEMIRAFLDAHRDEMIEDIKTLVRIDSSRAEAQEGKPYGPGAAQALEETTGILERYGFQVNNCENYAIDTSLCGDKELGLDILAHLDVVPGGDGWTKTTPFEPIEENGVLYGRGTADDKGPAMAALFAMRAVKELGIELKKDVRLILGSDEECGSSDIKYYFGKNTHAPMTISPDADFPLVFLEKGSLRTSFETKTEIEAALPRVNRIQSGIKVNVVPAKADAEVEGLTIPEMEAYAQKTEQETGAKITLTEQGSVVLVHVDGVSAHAAGPMDGINALTALLTFLTALPLAASQNTELLKRVVKLFPHGDFYGGGLGVNLEDEVSGKTTLTLDMFHLDENSMGGTFDSRTCTSANESNTKAVVEQKLTEAGFTHDNCPLNPPHYVPKDSTLVQTILAAYTEVTGEVREPIAIGGGTYVHHIENGVACGCADPAVDNHMHGPDEFALVEQLLMSAEVFAGIIIKLCA